MNSHISYAQKIHNILSSNEINLQNNDVPELDLINLTKPLVIISELNKKYSTVSYDKDFFSALTKDEETKFFNQITLMNKMLMSHLSDYYEQQTS